ncbi:unnamed protein product [Symbiodinium sp. KB8]|nr:unnamed protein product [Symbiodinium sp. KB8]
MEEHMDLIIALFQISPEGEFCMTDLQMVFLKMDEAPAHDVSQHWWQIYHECRAHPKFEEYRAYKQSLGLEVWHFENVFTYIDHVVADKASFILWIEECEKSKSAERSALQQMFGHPLFPSFCEAVSVPREKWGRDELYAMEELQLFQEWVAAKEIENTNPLQGMAPEPPRSDTMDTMETQLETQVDVSPPPHVMPPTTSMPPPTSMMPPPPPPPPYAEAADVPRPPEDSKEESDVRKRLSPVFDKASDNRDREMMVSAHALMKEDPAAFARSMLEGAKEDLQKMYRVVHKTLYGESPPPKPQVGY